MNLRIRGDYVCLDTDDGEGQIWMGRRDSTPSIANDGFETTLRLATAWTRVDRLGDLDDCMPVIEVAGVPVLPATFQSAWAWVSAGAPVDVAPTEFCGIRGVVLRGAGRVAILAQCMTLGELEAEA